ncbi:saccharopine dehydrogenase NADP-binding domain-containing protein [Kribbella sp. NPDC026611]|uniref:saccharopine dehydrogenase NADP-binding domain-containing protein n=1 Tax=Kribbella sp. NPDC026611 TaxID=3154911 RepID=UPI0033D1A29D
MKPVLVYGATGHTGRFVVDELRRQGLPVAVSGRNADALESVADGEPIHPAAADDSDALDRALATAAAVINCAGPFAVTAAPLIAAAGRAGIPYVDVAAEIEANVDTFARRSTTPVVPAMAFYGGLGDLLATAALDGHTKADEVHVAYGLSSWHPTPGTRLAGRVSHDRRGGRRVRFTGGVLRYHDDPPTEQDWEFPQLGIRRVIPEFSMADLVTIPSHLTVPEVRTYMTTTAAHDLADQNTPPPVGRSDQTFVVDVIVNADGRRHRATAHGEDIYAITAPLAVGAVVRLLDGRSHTQGVASAGAAFDALEFLRTLPLVLGGVGADLGGFQGGV